MTPSELLFLIKSLPADTPMTAEQVVNLISSLELPKPVVVHHEAYSVWDDDKLIDTETLAAWIGEQAQRLRKWRLDGSGPKYISHPGHVRYRVGDVRKWLSSRTVQSTAEADHKLAATKISKRSPRK